MDAHKPQPKNKSLLYYGAAISALIIALVALYFGMRGSDKGTGEQIELIVKQGDVQETVGARIKLVPRQSGLLTTVVGGTITEVIAVPGAKVKKGDPLLKLTNADYERQLINAVSEYAAAEADHIGIKMQSQDDVLLRQADLTRAQKTLEVTNIQLDSERKLAEKGITSQIMVRKLEAERAKQNAENIYATGRLKNALPAAHARIEASRLKLEVLRQRRDSLQAVVDGLVLKAPFDGTVATIESQMGKLLSPGAKGAEVITDELDMQVDVAEQDAGQLKPGLIITATRNGKLIEGVLTSIAPRADAGTVKATASISKSSSDLRSDTIINGEIHIGNVSNALYIETDNNNIEGIKTVVVVRRNGKESNVEATFGKRTGSRILVMAGLENNDAIIGLPELEVQ